MTRSARINLTPNDTAVLLAMDGSGGELGYMRFDLIASRSGVDRKSIRRIVRRLARAGHAQFARGLWTEDGHPAGAGYAITDTGRHAVATIPSPEPRS